MNVAQLKPDSLFFDLFDSLKFPRSNERGSIEAVGMLPHRRAGNSSFHVRMNVAQLKQSLSRRFRYILLSFHVRMNVAQLKQSMLKHWEEAALSFHVRMNVAQLKH